MNQKLMLGIFCATMLSAAAMGVLLTSLSVPYVPQTKEGCGAAALAMVMQYWMDKGAKVDVASADPAKILKELYEPERHGIAGAVMERYLRQNGFAAFAIDGRPEDLTAQLERGRPLIAALKLKGDTIHFVVLVGREQSPGRLLMHDPQRGPGIQMDWAAFQRAWKGTSNWLLVATPER